MWQVLECKSKYAGVLDVCLIPPTPNAKDSDRGFNIDLQREFNPRLSNLSFVFF